MLVATNPGSRLDLVARLELANKGRVIDRDSGDVVTLAGLLNTFRHDPSDDVIGLVRITIEPVDPRSLEITPIASRKAPR